MDPRTAKVIADVCEMKGLRGKEGEVMRILGMRAMAKGVKGTSAATDAAATGKGGDVPATATTSVGKGGNETVTTTTSVGKKKEKNARAG